MFKTFFFISHIPDLHKEQEKMTKNVIFFVTNFLSINSFAFTLKRSAFVKEPLLKTVPCVMYVGHLYTMKSSCGKIPKRICLKTKTWGVVRVVA